MLAWIQAASTTGLFVLVGIAVDDGLFGWAWWVQAVALAVVAAASAGVSAWFSPWASADAERKLRRTVLAHVLTGDPLDVEQRSGRLLALVTGSIERVAHYRSSFLGPMIGSLTTPMLVLVLMALLVDSPTAGWISLFVLSVPLVVGGFQRVVRPIGSAWREAQARLTADFLESVQGLGTLVLARAAQRRAVDLAAAGEDYRRRLMRLLAGNQLLIFVLDAAFSLSVVVMAAWQVMNRVGSGELTLGQGTAIMLMTTLIVGPVDIVGQFFYIGIGGRAAQRQFTALLESDPPGADPAGRQHSAVPGSPSARIHRSSPVARPHSGTLAASTPLTVRPVALREDRLAIPPAWCRSRRRPSVDPGLGGIALEDVSVAWPGGDPVLESLSLRVEQGERVALVGPSGVGKSTVAALVQAFLVPTAGRVVVDGLDTQTADPDEVRSRLAVVDQRTYLFAGSIGDNLRIAAPGATAEELADALAVAGLTEDIAAMPGGLDTRVGEHGLTLSGGQAQRLAIARAVLRQAPILILDEPTSQVDLAGEAAILAALERAAQDRTVLVIAHRPGAILAADRVIRLGMAVPLS
ncbi:MAG: ABC transporter ATP-binding protein/permease [Propioniciclava sp.]